MKLSMKMKINSQKMGPHTPTNIGPSFRVYVEVQSQRLINGCSMQTLSSTQMDRSVDGKFSVTLGFKQPMCDKLSSVNGPMKVRLTLPLSIHARQLQMLTTPVPPQKVLPCPHQLVAMFLFSPIISPICSCTLVRQWLRLHLICIIAHFHFGQFTVLMLPHYLGTIGGCPMVARGVATFQPLVATKQVASLCCLNLTLHLAVQPKCWPLIRASRMRRHSNCNSKLD